MKKVSLEKKHHNLTPELKTLHSLAGVLPTSEESKTRDRLQGAVLITNGLQLTKTFATIEYKIGISRNFHQFNVNADGDPNIEYRLSNSLSLEIPVTEKFSISTVGVYRLGQTYNGFQRHIYEFQADLNYEIAKQVVINLGTSNGGNSLKNNGVDSNISAYNEDTSVTRLGLNFIF